MSEVSVSRRRRSPSARLALPFKVSLARFWDSAIVGVSKPGGSLDRRVNCRRVPQPRWVDARRNAKGGKEVAGGRQA
jgi:hypothetical protein